MTIIPKSITVTTDKESYHAGDTILISGTVLDLYSGVPASLEIRDSVNNLMSTDQLKVNTDKKFSKKIIINENKNFKEYGKYIITISYGIVSRYDKSAFEFMK